MNFNERLVDYIAYGLKTYSTVEDKLFIDLVATLDSSVKVMCRKTLMKEISNRAIDDSERTKSMLKDAKYVATSSDIWSCSRHGYLGVVATAIMPNYKRVNRALACRHFENPHSGERIAELLIDVHDSNDLALPKLVGSISDNGGNIVKAFNIAGIDSKEERRDVVGDNLVDLLDELETIENALPSHQR